MEEVWKLTHNENYEVSSSGQVRNKKTGHMMKMMNANGYSIVKINGRGERVHRLVATAFLPNPDKKPQVNHKRLPKTNNCVANLEWCTASENMLSFFGSEEGVIKAQPLKFESDEEVIVCQSIKQASVHFGKAIGTLWSAVKRSDIKDDTKWRGYRISRITHDEMVALSAAA